MLTDPEDSRLWPFRVRVALLAPPLTFVGLLVVVGISKLLFNVPTNIDGTSLIFGSALLSLAPIGLVLIDVVLQRGAVIELKAAKLALSPFQTAQSSMFVPTNVGVPTQPVSDRDTILIIDTLRLAVNKDIAIIDLEQGSVWWETRLLILLAGAARLGRPAVIVFLATEGEIEKHFCGWARADSLLPSLLSADRRYQKSYARARVAAAQWSLVEPSLPGSFPGSPAPPSWIGGLAQQHAWMAHDSQTGLPNELAFEQFLAADLWESIEFPEGGKGMTMVRLNELFAPVLQKAVIEQAWSDEKRVEAVVQAPTGYIAVTQNGSFVRLISKEMGIAAIVGSLVDRKFTRAD